jgi:hypothetical protein
MTAQANGRDFFSIRFAMERSENRSYRDSAAPFCLSRCGIVSMMLPGSRKPRTGSPLADRETINQGTVCFSSFFWLRS